MELCIEIAYNAHDAATSVPVNIIGNGIPSVLFFSIILLSCNSGDPTKNTSIPVMSKPKRNSIIFGSSKAAYAKQTTVKAPAIPIFDHIFILNSFDAYQ